MFRFKVIFFIFIFFSTSQSVAQTGPKSDAQASPKSDAQASPKSDARTPAGIQGVTPAGTVAGRYQLFQGTYKISVQPNGATADSQGIIKLDTATGKTWLFFETVDLEKSERRRIWLPLEYNYE